MCSCLGNIYYLMLTNAPQSYRSGPQIYVESKINDFYWLYPTNHTTTSHFPIQIHTFRTSSIQLSHEKYPIVTSHYTGWRNHSLYYRSFLQVGSNPLQGQMFPNYSLVSPNQLHIFSTSLVTSMLANLTTFVYNETTNSLNVTQKNYHKYHWIISPHLWQRQFHLWLYSSSWNPMKITSTIVSPIISEYLCWLKTV